MFDSEVLLPDLYDILGAVPVTLAMALVVFVCSTIIGGLFAMVEYRRIPCSGNSSLPTRSPSRASLW